MRSAAAVRRGRSLLPDYSPSTSLALLRAYPGLTAARRTSE